MAKTKTNEEKKIDALKRQINALLEDNVDTRQRLMSIEAKAELYEDVLDWVALAKQLLEHGKTMAAAQRIARKK